MIALTRPPNRALLDALTLQLLDPSNTPQGREALDAAIESALDLLYEDMARLDWLAQHITNIDWSRYQNGDDIREIIDSRRTLPTLRPNDG